MKKGEKLPVKAIPPPLPLPAASPIKPVPPSLPLPAASPIKPVPPSLPLPAASPIKPVPPSLPLSSKPISPSPPLPAASPIKPVPPSLPLSSKSIPPSLPLPAASPSKPIPPSLPLPLPAGSPSKAIPHSLPLAAAPPIKPVPSSKQFYQREGYTMGNKDLEKKMIGYLDDDETLFNLCKTSPQIAQICRDENFWETRLRERFPFFHPLKPEGVTYRNFYLSTVGRIHELFDTLTIRSVVSNENDLRKYIFANMREHSALREASKKGYVNLIRFILEKVDSTLEQDDYLIKDAISDASKFGKLNVIRYFIEEKKINIKRYASYIIGVAGMKGQFEVVKYLVNRFKPNDMALILTAYGGHLPIVEYLIKHGADPNDVTEATLTDIGRKYPNVSDYIRSKQSDNL